jgi:hypothetical protein
MANIINSPPNTPVDQELTKGVFQVADGWRNFFAQVFMICSALTQSGTTAQRPTKFLWVGRTYLDLTLTRPIWWSGTNWIRADGVVV